MNKPRLTEGLYQLERISTSVKSNQAKVCQKLCRKEDFRVETLAFGEENLGRANLGKPIEGISKSNSSEIDFTASKIIKPATPTITTANRMLLRHMKKN